MEKFEELLKTYVEHYHHILETNKGQMDQSFDKLDEARKKSDLFNLHGKKEKVEKLTKEAWWNAGWAGGMAVTVGVLDRLWSYYLTEKQTAGE